MSAAATSILEATAAARYRIDGGQPLRGTVQVQGAKNAVLPMIAAALLVEKGQTILHNVPPLNDVFVQIALAEHAGAKVIYDAETRILTIDASSVSRSLLDPGLTSRSRGSILFLPPVLHRLGKVEFRGIGGCSLGVRRLDFHHNGFKRLGAEVEGVHDHLTIKASGLKGNLVYLDIPSQTATENLIMAACLASGTTIIENAASEPEVVDFRNFLKKMGANIAGAGTATIAIDGVERLRAVEYTVMSDRLEAGSLMMAAAITHGDVAIVGAHLDQMRILKVKLEQMGATIVTDGPLVRVCGPEKLKPINTVTWPYPGLSTDFLPGLMALASIADGTSYLRENVFKDRFTQAKGLNSLGAKITLEGSLAKIEGVGRLTGAMVTAPDLRAGMSFVLAALAADGETVIDNIYQIERGHSDVPQRLEKLGANIVRDSAGPCTTAQTAVVSQSAHTRRFSQGKTNEEPLEQRS